MILHRQAVLDQAQRLAQSGGIFGLIRLVPTVKAPPAARYVDAGALAVVMSELTADKVDFTASEDFGTLTMKEVRDVGEPAVRTLPVVSA